MSGKEKDLIELINILLTVVEANKGVPAGEDDRILDAEGLVLKFYGHILSTLFLYRGVDLPDLTIPIKNFPDPSSVDVLTRAAFETFLIFYYIYLDSDNEDETSFRYYSWEITGLYERQKFPASTKENIAKLESEKALIEKIREKIKNNSLFKSFTERQQKNFFKRLEKGNWRTKGWADIALSAGFSELNSRIIYRFLCDHAHSGNISITQVRQAKDFNIRKELLEAPIGHLLICVANMIKHYCEFFPKSNEFYSIHYKEPNIVTLWIDVGAERE